MTLNGKCLIQNKQIKMPSLNYSKDYEFHGCTSNYYQCLIIFMKSIIPVIISKAPVAPVSGQGLTFPFI
jgi:hypothetical protein